MDEVVQVHRTEVCGIPTFWSPGPEPLSAALVFGTGTADESLRSRGITHLVEHLALFGLDHRQIEFNGHVTDSTTVFASSGTVDDVNRVFAKVGAAFTHGLPLDRLDHERRILRTEAQSRGATRFGTHLAYRYGPAGVGLLDYPELGLRWLGGDEVSSWAGRFNASTAALVLSGPPPEALVVDLPDRPKPPVADAPVDLLAGPTWATCPGNVVAFSMPGPRTAAWKLALGTLALVAEERLRQVEGRSYAVLWDYLPSGPDRADTYLGADCLDDDVEAVRDALAAELARLGTKGPEAAELDAARALVRRSYTDPRRSLGVAYGMAESLVTGGPMVTPEELLEEYDEVTPSDIADVLLDATERALWTLPHGKEMTDGRYLPLPEWSTERLHGHEYEPGSHLDPARTDDRLVIGTDGVTIGVGEHALTARWGAVAAALRFNDRCWVLYGTDGFVLTVRARDWFRGGAAVEQISTLVPPSVVIDMADPLAPDETDTDAAAPLRPPRAGRRRLFGKLARR